MVKKAALTADEAQFWDFSVQTVAGAPAQFKAKLVYPLTDADCGEPAWSEIRLFARTGRAGGYVLAVSAMREGIGLDNLHLAAPVETLEEALAALEAADVTAEVKLRKAKKPETAIARAAIRGRLHAYARQHAHLADQALQDIAALAASDTRSGAA